MGRRGRIRVKGGLPLTADNSPTADAVLPPTAISMDTEAKAGVKEPARAGLLVDVHGLEMRVRNVYTGRLPHLCSPLVSICCRRTPAAVTNVPSPVVRWAMSPDMCEQGLSARRISGCWTEAA